MLLSQRLGYPISHISSFVIYAHLNAIETCAGMESIRTRHTLGIVIILILAVVASSASLLACVIDAAALAPDRDVGRGNAREGNEPGSDSLLHFERV